jgi:hypothetical protein
MSISEQSRHQLYQRLEEILGPGPAATLMEHLPPVGWSDVATKRDLEALEGRLQGQFGQEFGRVHEEFGRVHEELGRVWQEFGRVHEELGRVREEIAGWGRTIVLTNVAAVMAAVGFAFAAARL